MDSVVDPQGNLRIPLHHGTSTLFGDSILAHGLGAVSPIEHLDALSFLGNVATLCRKYLSEDNEWIANEYVVRQIECQRTASFNFRHGSAYLTPSKLTARRYATSNEYGSELISTALEWWSRLTEVHEARSDLKPYRSHPILGLIGQLRRPLLVRADAVPLEYLRDEHGSDARATIEELDRTLGEHKSFREGLWQQMNFELASPLCVERLSFTVLEPCDPGDPTSKLVERPWIAGPRSAV
jgi:hypothetical protein